MRSKTQASQPTARLEDPENDTRGCRCAQAALNRVRKAPRFKRSRRNALPKSDPVKCSRHFENVRLTSQASESVVVELAKAFAHQSYDANLELVRVDTVCVRSSPGMDWLIGQPEVFVRKAGELLLAADLRERMEFFEIYAQWYFAHRINISVHTLNDGCAAATVSAADLEFSWLGLFSTLIEELGRVRHGKPISTALMHAATTIAARTGMTFAIKNLAAGAAVWFWSATAALAFGIVGGVVGAWLGGRVARWLNRRGFDAACREFVARMKQANLRIRQYTREHDDQIRAVRTQGRRRLKKLLERNDRRLQRARKLLSADARLLIEQYRTTCLAQIDRRCAVLTRGKARMLGVVSRSRIKGWLPQIGIDLPRDLKSAYTYEMEQLQKLKSTLEAIGDRAQLCAWLTALNATCIQVDALARSTIAFSERLDALLDRRDRLIGRAERRQAAIRRTSAADLAKQEANIARAYRGKCKGELARVDEQFAIVQQTGRDVGLTAGIDAQLQRACAA